MERRIFLKDCALTGISTVAISTCLITPSLSLAKEFDPFQATSVNAVSEALGIADAKPSDRIKITVPKIAENGASVPVVIASDIPGTTEIITVVANNPKPLAARNRFGKGAVTAVSSRIKMGKTTDVIAFVKVGDTYYTAKTRVKVTVDGCGG